MSIGICDGVTDLYVEFLYLWVSRGRGADGVMSRINNESFGGFSEVRDVTLGLWTWPPPNFFMQTGPLTYLCTDLIYLHGLGPHLNFVYELGSSVAKKTRFF